MSKSAELKSIEGLWKNTKPAENKVKPRPTEGTFPATIDAITIKMAKTSKRWQVEWLLILDGGPEKGREIMRFNGLDKEEQISYLKRDCDKLGIKVPDKIGLLEDALKKYEGMQIEVSIKHQKDNDQYYNVWFNKAISDAPPTSSKDDEDDDGMEVVHDDEESA